jgi:hypothetical protein
MASGARRPRSVGPALAARDDRDGEVAPGEELGKRLRVEEAPDEEEGGRGP